MISLHHSRRSAFLFRNSLIILLIVCFRKMPAQELAVFHDNQGRFQIFDSGKLFQAEYLPVKKYSIGGRCLLYTDNRNNLKMYYQGKITTLEVNAPQQFEALDYLSVYNIGGIVKIIENGRIITVSTHAIHYQSEDSLVTFYDADRELLAAYYKGKIHQLEDGLAGKPANNFKTGDNLVAYISSRTLDLKVFYLGETRVIESFLSGGSFKAGRDIVAYINKADLKFRVFYRGEVFESEEFPPETWKVGDGIVAYVDNTGSFKIFADGETTVINSFAPDFYQVHNQMVIYGEHGYLKVWYKNRPYTLETFIPADWMAEWNTIVYRDQNRNVKVFSKGESRVLTYDLAENIELNRDIVVVNKGMNNHDVYYKGKKY